MPFRFRRNKKGHKQGEKQTQRVEAEKKKQEEGKQKKEKQIAKENALMYTVKTNPKLFLKKNFKKNFFFFILDDFNSKNEMTQTRSNTVKTRTTTNTCEQQVRMRMAWN